MPVQSPTEAVNLCKHMFISVDLYHSIIVCHMMTTCFVTDLRSVPLDCVTTGILLSKGLKQSDCPIDFTVILGESCFLFQDFNL